PRRHGGPVRAAIGVRAHGDSASCLREHRRLMFPFFMLWTHPNDSMVKCLLTTYYSHSCTPPVRCLFLRFWVYHLLYLPPYFARRRDRKCTTRITARESRSSRGGFRYSAFC